MSANCVVPTIAFDGACVSVVSDADAAGYGWWVAGFEVDWETVDLATFDRELRARWNGMKPEERAEWNAYAAEAIAALARDPLDEACSREILWMKRAEAEDRDRERLVSPPWSQREREEMERAVAREVKAMKQSW
jgi:hypothetical protein